MPGTDLKSNFQIILDGYLSAKTQPFAPSLDHPVNNAFRTLHNVLNRSQPVTGRKGVGVTYSTGKGNWTNVPWIAVLHSSEGQSVQSGIYCVYLFRQDMSGFYLSLALGVTKLIEEKGRAQGRKALADKTSQVRTLLSKRGISGFLIDSGIDLRATGGVGADYSHGTIAYKFYGTRAVPEDKELLADLEAGLTAVDETLKSYGKALSPKRYWIGGASWSGKDKTQEFVANGIWVNGYEDQLLDKVNEIEPGDSFAIKSSFVVGGDTPALRIKAIGEVTSTNKDGRTISVNWKREFTPFDIHGLSKRTTLHEITDQKEISEIFSVNRGKKSPPDSGGFVGNNRKHLNRILFGPPGTGKTYRLQSMMLASRDHTKASGLPDEVNEMPWVDVIALTIDALGGSATVPEMVKHPFIKSKLKHLKRTKNIGQTMWSTLQRHTVLTSTTVAYEERSPRQLFDKQGESTWILVKGLPEELREAKTKVQTLATAPPTESVKHGFEFVTFHQALGYEEFVEGIRPLDAEHPENESEELTYKVLDGVFKRACLSALEAAGYDGTVSEFCALSKEERQRILSSAPDYVFCIDEINRANCSKVFGELITLIEDDKRLGSKNELILTLPYSREKFGVPNNLMIVGTMNTADKSVETIDIALRRRFVFEELLPQYSLLGSVGSVDLAKLLLTINARLTRLLDRDHQIGHSFLLDIVSEQQLKDVFRGKIIPLLREFFYSDWNKIGFVLGSRFIRPSMESNLKLASFGNSTEAYEEATVYELVDVESLTLSDFESIYRGD